MARTILLLLASLAVWGQPAAGNSPPPLPMPEWLTPFPHARDESATSAPTEGVSNYTALGRTAEVVAYYQQQLRAAGIDFKAQSDGLGVSITAAKDEVSAVIRIRDYDDTSRVRVSYAIAHGQAQAPVSGSQRPLTRQQSQPIAPVPQPVAATAAKREPITPWTHVPYVWIMQSVIVRGSNPRKYTAAYYEAPTDRTIERPLDLPNGASIVDAVPDDCEFFLQDQAGHSITYKKAAEAKGQRLAPGSWSLYPVKCSGVDIYLH